MSKRREKYIRIGKDAPFYCMSSKGSVSEARLIVAERLGRPLNRSEIVHHIDGNPLNNGNTNLMLTSYKDHYLISARDALRNKIIRFERLLPLWRQELEHLEGLLKILDLDV